MKLLNMSYCNILATKFFKSKDLKTSVKPEVFFSFCRRLQLCQTRIHSMIWWTVWKNRAWRQCPKDTWGGKALIWTWLSSSTSMRFETSLKIIRKILQADIYLLLKICFQLVSAVPIQWVRLHTVFIVRSIVLPLHTPSTFPPDDPTAWRWGRWQPASTNGTPGPPSSQPRGRGQKAWPGEEAEPPGLSWAIRTCLPLQPCVPTESRLPPFQWTESWGCEREVREGDTTKLKGN